MRMRLGIWALGRCGWECKFHGSTGQSARRGVSSPILWVNLFGNQQHFCAVISANSSSSRARIVAFLASGRGRGRAGLQQLAKSITSTLSATSSLPQRNGSAMVTFRSAFSDPEFVSVRVGSLCIRSPCCGGISSPRMPVASVTYPTLHKAKPSFTCFTRPRLKTRGTRYAAPVSPAFTRHRGCTRGMRVRGAGMRMHAVRWHSK